MTHDMAEDGRSLPAELTTDDINSTINCEPRVADLRVAEALGFDRPRDIRKLVERHREALERFGKVCATVAQNSEHIGEVSATVAENTEQKGRGRPGRAYWLNKRQALYLATKSETPNATEVVIQMVEVFDAWTAGHLPPAPGGGTPAPETDKKRRRLPGRPEFVHPPFCGPCAARVRWMRDPAAHNPLMSQPIDDPELDVLDAVRLICGMVIKRRLQELADRPNLY